jgi:hypothetical protein
MHGAIPPPPNMPSWHSAQLEKSTGTPLPKNYSLLNLEGALRLGCVTNVKVCYTKFITVAVQKCLFL